MEYLVAPLIIGLFFFEGSQLHFKYRKEVNVISYILFVLFIIECINRLPV